MPQIILVVLNTFDKELKSKVRAFAEQYSSKDVWVLNPRQIIQKGISGFPQVTCIVVGEDYINPKCYPESKLIVQTNGADYSYAIERFTSKYNIDKIQ